MHELSVCQALIGQVEAIAREHQAKRVASILLGIGPLSGVEPQLLQQAFPIASAGTIADEAELLEPTCPVVHLLKAEIHEARGLTDEARQCCRAALATVIDYEPAIHTLMGLCDAKADRVAELKFLSSQLVSQVIHGETIFAFCRYATGVLEHDELLGTLQPSPDTILATVSITRTFDTREAAIQAKLETGSLERGYQVTAVRLSPPEVTLTGQEAVLDQVDDFVATAPINLACPPPCQRAYRPGRSRSCLSARSRCWLRWRRSRVWSWCP